VISIAIEGSKPHPKRLLKEWGVFFVLVGWQSNNVNL